MREVLPDLPIVLTSGFTGDATAEQLAELESVKFIKKPYRRPRALRRRVVQRVRGAPAVHEAGRRLAACERHTVRRAP
jgi:hypothetical protein